MDSQISKEGEGEGGSGDGGWKEWGEVGRRGERDRETDGALVPLLLQQKRLTVMTQVHLWSGGAPFTDNTDNITHYIWVVMRIWHPNMHTMGECESVKKSTSLQIQN